MHSERTPSTTPLCDLGESCRVELVAENEAVAQIFLLVRGQQEVRWNGERDIAVDINHLAVWKAIEKYPGGIHDEWDTFNRIVNVWHKIMRNKDR